MKASRRGFLRAIAGVVAAPKLVTQAALPAAPPAIPHYTHVQYALGFRVSARDADQAQRLSFMAAKLADSAKRQLERAALDLAGCQMRSVTAEVDLVPEAIPDNLEQRT